MSDHDDDKPEAATSTMHDDGDDASTEDAPAHEEGSLDWVEDLAALQSAPEEPAIAPLPQPDRRSTSHHLTQVAPSRLGQHAANNRRAMAFGSEVHQLLEAITWLDEQPPTLPDNAAGESAKRLLEADSTRKYFMREGRDIRLLREQAVDAVIDGQWISGVIDRLHLHCDANGAVTRVEIIDFKTDALDDTATLAATYAEQLQAYRKCLQQLHPDAQISCVLLSTHLAEAVKV